MQLLHLTILNYKNITQADLLFSPKINCFIGNNGMGKTNLLDAIYYLSFCKSFTNPADMQNIKHDADFFVLQGNYMRNGSNEEAYCGLKRKQKKQFKLNKKEYERLSDHIGFLPLVIISPADSVLVSEGSDERRRFIDSVISQYNRHYLSELIRYNKALMQRNMLLKGTMQDELVYDIWEEQMAEAGTYIFEVRKAFVEEFIPIFQSRFRFISSGNEEVSLQYQTQLATCRFRDALQQSRERDRILGYTTVGIHKDDLEMLLGNYPIKRVGSQGQNKTFLVSLKFAQFDFLKRASEKLTPLLLLDDIFDKLDAERVGRIIELVSGDTFGQIFITDTNREHLDHLLNKTECEVSYFFVDRGEVSPL